MTAPAPVPAPVPVPVPSQAAAQPGQLADAAAARRVWAGLREVVLAPDGPRRAVCEALGMSFVRVKALRHLVAGPLTQRELAEGLSTDKAYTTVMLDDLEQRGLVRRTPHPVDRRAKLVTLTPAGAAAAARSEEILGVPPPALATMDSAELAVLERLVARLRPS